MLTSDDLAPLTPAERFDEVAHILAYAVLRSTLPADLTGNRGSHAAAPRNPYE